MRPLTRRKFLQVTAPVLGAGFGLTHFKAFQSEKKEYQGLDFTDWEVVLGDGLYAAPGQSPASLDDIETIHLGDHSTLRANILDRGVMAHNITFKRIIDDAAFAYIHTCGYQFRLPDLPDQSRADLNGQTLEGGIFVWDGSGGRLDFGVGFQWVLNPWDANLGGMFTWTGSEWTLVGKLEPDTAWHEAKMIVDFRRETTAFLIDGVHYPTRFTTTTKPDTWGRETAARLQAEIVSLFPGDSGSGTLYEAEFRNWFWIWEPNTPA